ncbi:MAG TPA: tripartite tricarboxylate transporter substrate binding protein [Burkholderiaceae bacterium]|jgi:tripartite-type tricarboxylate transporter receptor subunit TctC|nr:tripartite tricarboxylate transporter substrate binding protein [Burkholderiaceae bacterium]
MRHGIHRRQVLGALAAGAAMPAAFAQGGLERYPARPVKFVVPASVGGPSDLVARMVGQRLGDALGQPVVVENLPGAGMALGTQAVVKAAPDGHTLLFTTSTPIVMTPFTVKKLTYDVKKDLVTVAHVGSTPLVLYVNASTPARSVKDLVELARAKPGELSYGSYGVGSSAHVLMEYLARQQGVKLVHVPYKGVSPQIQDLAGGQVVAAVADVGVPAPFVRNGRIRPIAVTGTRRAAALPDVPTFAEQGITGMEPFSPWWGLFAPAGTPDPIVARLGAETARIVRTPDFTTKLAELGGDATGESAQQAGAMVRDEWARWERIIGSLSGISFE